MTDLNEARQRWKPLYEDDSAIATEAAVELQAFLQRRYGAHMPYRAIPNFAQHVRAWLRNETMAAVEHEGTAAFLDALLATESPPERSLAEALEEVSS